MCYSLLFNPILFMVDFAWDTKLMDGLFVLVRLCCLYMYVVMIMDVYFLSNEPLILKKKDVVNVLYIVITIAA